MNHRLNVDVTEAFRGETSMPPTADAALTYLELPSMSCFMMSLVRIEPPSPFLSLPPDLLPLDLPPLLPRDNRDPSAMIGEPGTTKPPLDITGLAGSAADAFGT